MTDAWGLLGEHLARVGGAMARTPDPRDLEHAMASPIRRRMLDAVRERSGVTLSDLRRDAGLGWGAFYHQLRYLEEAGLVRVVAAGRRRLAVAQDHAPHDAILRARGILAGATAIQVARIIAQGECRNVLQLARTAQLDPRTASYHVRRLVEAGLVASASRSRYVDLKPTPLLSRLLEAEE